MRNNQPKALKCAYIVMKEKLLKYNIQVTIKSMFPIAKVLNLRFKLEHIPYDEHNLTCLN